MELRIYCLRRNPYMFPYDTTTQANLKVFLFLFTTIPSSSSQPIFYLSIHHKEILTAILPSSRPSSSSSSHHNNHFMKWELESTAFFFGPLTIHGSKIPNLLLTLSARPSSLPRYKSSSFQAQKNANPQDPRTRLLDKREEIWCEREGGIALSASNGVSGPRRYEAFGDKLSF